MTERTTYHNMMTKRYVVYVTVKRADGVTLSNMPLAHETTKTDAEKRMAQIKRDGLDGWDIEGIGYYSEIVAA